MSAALHPLKKNKKSFNQAEAVRNLYIKYGIKISPAYLCLILNGERNPEAPKAALVLKILKEHYSNMFSAQ